MPVPIVMPTACRAPFAAPIHHSPSTAQLASLSSAACRSSPADTRSRSGMLVQPRLGVSSTTPRLRSSGPGAPTPTPAISTVGSVARVSAMDRRASVSRRSITLSAPGSGLGRLAHQSVQRRAVLGDTADDEIGAADVDAHDVSHVSRSQ